MTGYSQDNHKTKRSNLCHLPNGVAFLFYFINHIIPTTGGLPSIPRTVLIIFLNRLDTPMIVEIAIPTPEIKVATSLDDTASSLCKPINPNIAMMALTVADIFSGSAELFRNQSKNFFNLSIFLV